jgi:bifunctional non-homologous end joining protein LigD
MLCESGERPPEEREWRYELKLDGFRAIGRKSGRSAQLWSRNQKDFTGRFAGLSYGYRGPPNDSVIDGKIVALDVNGKPSFNLLQTSVMPTLSSSTHSTFSCCLAKMLRLWPLDERHEQLREIVGSEMHNVAHSICQAGS